MRINNFNIYKPSPKSIVVFVRFGKRRFELEVNWVTKFTVSFYTGVKGSFVRKIF